MSRLIIEKKGRNIIFLQFTKHGIDLIEKPLGQEKEKMYYNTVIGSLSIADPGFTVRVKDWIIIVIKWYFTFHNRVMQVLLKDGHF